MSRYIDADAVIARVAGAMAYETEMETGEFIDCIEDAEELLNGIPTIDIVRCGECKHRTYCYSEVHMTNKRQSVNIHKDIDFCSYGERKDR